VTAHFPADRLAAIGARCAGDGGEVPTFQPPSVEEPSAGEMAEASDAALAAQDTDIGLLGGPSRASDDL